MVRMFKPPQRSPAIPRTIIRMAGTMAKAKFNWARFVIERIQELPPPRVNVPEGFTGFTHCGHCATPTPGIYEYRGFTQFYIGPGPSGCNQANNCLAGQGPAAFPQTWPPPFNTNTRSIGKGGIYIGGGGLPNAQVVDWWWRKVSGAYSYVPARQYVPYTAPTFPYPAWAPALPEVKPLELPHAPGGPRPMPRYVTRVRPATAPAYYETGPSRRPSRNPATRPAPLSPGDAPSRQPQRQPGTRPRRPRPAPGEAAVPRPTVYPKPSITTPTPGTPVDADVVASPGGGAVYVRPSTHRSATPPRGVRERKATIAGGTRAVTVVYGAVTEAKDVIEAVWQALPRSSRTPGANVTQMTQDLWRHYDEIDVSTAVQNLIYNQAIDAVIGKANKVGLKRWQQDLPAWWRSPRGPAMGSRYTQSTIASWSRF